MTQKELYDKLAYKTKYVYEHISDAQKQEMFELCDEYKEFLNKGKTERECISQAESMAIENGFVNIDTKAEIKAGEDL
jgi:aspartyl aminopeptidase